MSLQAILDTASSNGFNKQGTSEERVRAVLPQMRTAIAFYRKYPDIFIDTIKGPDCIFKFYTYQRVFLRIVMRHRYTYAVYPRAYIRNAPIILKKIWTNLFNCWNPKNYIFVKNHAETNM